MGSAVDDQQLIRAADFAGEADTAAAHYAAIDKERDRRPQRAAAAGERLDVGPPLILAVLEVIVLQQALSGLVANGAIDRVPQEQVFLDHGPRLLALTRRMQSELAQACSQPPSAIRSKPLVADQPSARATEPFSASNLPSGRSAAPAARPPARATEPFPASPPATATFADPGLVGRVAAAIQRCRQFRCPVSLALLEVDAFSDMLVRLGPTKTTDLVHRLRLALADWTSQRTAAVLISDSSFALVWEDCPRNEAVRLVRQALVSVKGWSHSQSDAAATISLSAGLATIEFPPKNFPAPELVRAAERCLAGAQLSGGDAVKSIEL